MFWLVLTTIVILAINFSKFKKQFDTLQETSEKYTPNDEYENSDTAQREAAA